MTNKEHFIEDIENLVEQLSEEGLKYFEELKSKKESSPVTKKGAPILIFMQENCELRNNLFTSKLIAEGLGTNGRAVSGSMRKLVTEGLVIKVSQNPVTYSLTDLGKSYSVEQN